MSVRNGFTIEIYGCTHVVYVLFCHVPLMVTSRRLTAQQRDERPTG